jgi:hypothetical protein
MSDCRRGPELDVFRANVRRFIDENLPPATRQKTSAGIELTGAEFRE